MSMMSDFFKKLEPMQKRHIAELTLFPLKASVKCDLENIKTFDELADLVLARALELDGGASATSVNTERRLAR